MALATHTMQAFRGDLLAAFRKWVVGEMEG
jgi:hypothetical protein